MNGLNSGLNSALLGPTNENNAEANINKLMNDASVNDINNMDISSFMKDPSMINNMLDDFSTEEKDEFSGLLTQFGMSGDIDAVVGDLFGDQTGNIPPGSKDGFGVKSKNENEAPDEEMSDA